MQLTDLKLNDYDFPCQDCLADVGVRCSSFQRNKEQADGWASGQRQPYCHASRRTAKRDFLDNLETHALMVSSPIFFGRLVEAEVHLLHQARTKTEVRSRGRRIAAIQQVFQDGLKRRGA
jgi:hypothetical protein